MSGCGRRLLPTAVAAIDSADLSGRVVGLAVVVLVLVGGGVAAPVAAGTDAPLADAGLDQSVERGSTVLLDAGGSHAPDGEIVDYEWSVEPPAGGSVMVDCSTDDCERAAFPAASAGTYRVTLTVRDGEGRTDSDVMYVEVDDVGFEVEVLGPATVPRGEEATLVASITATEATPDRIVWERDGARVANATLPDGNATDSVAIEPDGDRSRATATVYAEDGDTVRDDHVVAVVEDGGDVPDDSDGAGTGTPPHIEGPRTVTGDSLTAEYTLKGYYAFFHGDRTVWSDDQGARVGRGTTVTVEWEPGDRELYAHAAGYRNGTGTVGFEPWTSPDSPEHGVTVDPRPDVELSDAGAEGAVVSVDVAAEERYSALDPVTVEIAGEEVLNRSGVETVDATVSRELADRRGESVRVVATARDERGQVARDSTRVSVPLSDSAPDDPSGSSSVPASSLPDGPLYGPGPSSGSSSSDAGTDDDPDDGSSSGGSLRGALRSAAGAIAGLASSAGSAAWSAASTAASGASSAASTAASAASSAASAAASAASSAASTASSIASSLF